MLDTTPYFAAYALSPCYAQYESRQLFVTTAQPRYAMPRHISTRHICHCFTIVAIAAAAIPYADAAL